MYLKFAYNTNITATVLVNQLTPY